MLVAVKKQIKLLYKSKKLTIQQQRMNTFLRYLELFCCERVRKFLTFI